MKPSLHLAMLIGAGLAFVAAAPQSESAEADAELDLVVEMLEEARAEIREFRKLGGEDDDPEHPGRKWAGQLWRYREEHPGTPAAARATTESIHFMLHAGRQEEAIERALAVPAGDGAWPTLINILFEAAGLRGEYGFFAQKARAMVETERDPETRARLLFRLAQADWVEGDISGAEAWLTELEDTALDPEWEARFAAARGEIESSTGRLGDRAGREARDLWQRPGRVMEALDLATGDHVADVGSGEGYFTFQLARRVGVEGRVYAVDIEKMPLEKVRTRAEELGLGQVETVLGAVDAPRLPEGALAAILVVDTYHEMRSFEAMMEGMSSALAPGGRLAIVDIPGDLGRERDEYHERHRIPVELVIQEAARAGLRLRSFDRDFAHQPGGRRFYLVVFEKDASAAGE